MRTITESIQNQPSGKTNHNYSPSVPLSVYRDLAGELQATQAKLDTLITKNQELAQENHLLRQEIATVVKSVLNLQKWADTSDNNRGTTASPVEHHAQTYQSPSQVSPSPEIATNDFEVELPTPPPTPQSHGDNSFFTIPGIEMPVSPEPVYLEEQEVAYYPTSEDKKVASGWWLALCVLLVIFTAFGTGYLIVRPLFQNNSR